VGGAWNWRHDRSPIYGSTHLISSKPFTQYPDFPLPDEYPDYPHHAQLLGYFERYAEHFDLRQHIWFGTEVAKVDPAPAGNAGAPPAWDVTIRGSQGGAPRTLRYAAVVVANGHNWSPKLPEYDGLEDFRGEVIHASAYKDSAQLRNRKVLVVGGGNTGCDLASDAASHAARCWHSTRRGYWYTPKYVLGRPTDQVNDAMRMLRIPLWLRQWMASRLLRATVGDPSRFGLQKPDHKVYETHPIVNSLLMYHLGHGAITPMPDVARFGRNEVTFTDGTTAEPDLVIMATGYLPRFEFLSPDILDVDSDGRPRMALQMFSRSYPTLAVAGLLQPDSGIFTIVHWQTVVIAKWLRLLEVAPERATAFWSSRSGQPGHRFTKARVKDSTRHWFEMDHIAYLRALQSALDDLEPAR
jgi:cation diffusion facilitator CzcD-associated flavoprotein CzcO